MRTCQLWQLAAGSWDQAPASWGTWLGLGVCLGGNSVQQLMHFRSLEHDLAIFDLFKLNWFLKIGAEGRHYLRGLSLSPVSYSQLPIYPCIIAAESQAGLVGPKVVFTFICCAPH